MNKNKSEKTINIATDNQPAAPGMPLLNLSMSDKIYLAVSRQSKNNFHYIHSLVCHRVSGSNYNLIPDCEIATFKDNAQADVYYNTLLQIKDFQSRGLGYNDIRDFAKNYIDAFNQKSR